MATSHKPEFTGHVVIDDEPYEDDCCNELPQVLEHIADHGLFSETILLLRKIDERYELAVPPTIRRHWMINPPEQWGDDFPIAYRVDGFHIWPSDSFSHPYLASFSVDAIHSDGDVLRFRTIEDAMKLVDSWFPTGRKVAYPESLEPGRGRGRLIRFLSAMDG